MATSGGSGGCTTTGAAARKVYNSPELRERLVELCPTAFKDAYREILATSEFCPLVSPASLSVYLCAFVVLCTTQTRCC